MDGGEKEGRKRKKIKRGKEKSKRLRRWCKRI